MIYWHYKATGTAIITTGYPSQPTGSSKRNDPAIRLRISICPCLLPMLFYEALPGLTPVVQSNSKEVIEIRRLQTLLGSLTLSYWPCLFLIPLAYGKDSSLISIPYLLEVLTLLLYTMPFYIAFLTLGASISEALSKTQSAKGEGILKCISCVVACLIFSTAFKLSSLLYPALVLSAFLLLLRICTAVIYKKKPGIFTLIKQKSFWLCTVVILLLLAVLSVIVFGR